MTKGGIHNFSIREFLFVRSRKACVPVLKEILLRHFKEIKRPGEQAPAVCVHILVSERAAMMTVCAMRKFELSTNLAWKFILHDDGSLSGASISRFEEFFPDCRVVRRGVADVEMLNVLEGLPFLSKMRETNVLGLKLLDTWRYAESDNYIVLDGDLIFFRYPDEVVAWANKMDDSCWFNRDNGEVYSIPRAAIENAFSLALWPAVNSGLSLMRREAIDLLLAEEFLRKLGGATKKAHFHEQTLFAFLASAYGKGGLLPEDYRILWDRQFPKDAISCHYVGEGKWHTLYFHLFQRVLTERGGRRS